MIIKHLLWSDTNSSTQQLHQQLPTASNSPLHQQPTEAIAVADKAVNQLVELKRLIEGAALDAEWSNLPDDQKKVFKKGNGYYIISFTKTEAEKKLYVLLSDSGRVYDANYSGKFPGLKDES